MATLTTRFIGLESGTFFFDGRATVSAVRPLAACPTSSVTNSDTTAATFFSGLESTTFFEGLEILSSSTAFA